MRKSKTDKRPALKQAKVQLRLSAEQKEAITRAARLRQTTLSNFLLENGYSAAQQVLAEQVHFALPPDRWQAFCAALDAPPRDIPALRNLLTEPGIFDERAGTP
jgi:uncharacterized protein (DUF1778 family)